MEKIITKVTDKIIEGLRIATHELEEFQLQLALGKAEAADKYEEVKKKLNAIIFVAKEKMKGENENETDLKNKFDELLTIFAIEKAETKEIFEEQKKRIFKVIKEVDEILEKNKIELNLSSFIKTEMEKFKIKMEIISLRFDLKKIDVKESIENNRKDFFELLDRISSKFSKKDCSTKSNREEFWNEMNTAYKHLKKAFKHS